MRWITPYSLVLFLVAFLLPADRQAFSDTLDMPSGPVILVVSGAIANSNVNGEAHFDYQMLEDLGLVKLVTWTPWTEGMPEFEGVRAGDLMSAVGARGKHLHARALNDYKVEIPISDFDRYEVIFALKQDGQRMRVRDKGPIWVIYRNPSSMDVRDKMIWQLNELRVE